MKKQAIIQAIEQDLQAKNLHPKQIEIGAQDLQTLGSLIKVNNLFHTKKCITFSCNESESDEIVGYFIGKGMKKSNFSMSSQPSLFLMY